LQSTFAIGGDLEVRRLGFGAMRLDSSDPATRPGALDVLRRAVELGVQLIDTAYLYGAGANEELVAEALHPYADGVAIATKAGVRRAQPSGWEAVGRPEYLRAQADAALRRLRVERLELFQLHRVDPEVPFAEQLGALSGLQDEGKVRHIGLSEVTVEQLDEARSLARIASVQNRYNLADRGHEAVLERCVEHGIAFLPWQPIASVRAGNGLPELHAVSDELGATPAQVSIAWLLHHAPAILPIPGTTTIAHLEENVAAAELELSPEQMARLSG
jgi:aryl-alcohol dehydrogenase-like predicted oxidoreductase